MNYRSLSKFLSLVLRHEADQFNVTLDKHGWAPIVQIMEVMKRKQPGFSLADLEYMVRASDKQRYEIRGQLIRARYGHSVPVDPITPPVEPPETLYHGTAARNLPTIFRDGLKAMSRRFVHLTPDKNLAASVGRRHSPNIVVLKIRALDAHHAGVAFYEEHNFWLTEFIPAEFVEVTENEINEQS